MSKKVLRILHVIGTMNYGGAETYVMNIYRNIDRERIQFDFLAFGGEGAYDGEIKKLGGRIFYFNRHLYNNPIAYCKELEMFFKSHKEYSIVHFHLNNMSGFAVRAARRAGIPYLICHAHIANPQTDFLRKIVQREGRKLVGKYADYIFGCSNEAVDYLTEFYNGEKTVIRNAIDVGKFVFSSENSKRIRTSLGIRDNEIVLVNVARFAKQKNHSFTIELFSEIKKMRDDCHLILIGEGSLRQEIEDKVDSLGLKDSVHFVGTQSNVEEWLSAADVFLFPSLYEGLGIAVVEAQANGLVCAVSDTVPREADLKTGQVAFLPLDNMEQWTNFVLSAKRFEDFSAIRIAASKAGYDIADVSRQITEFYENTYQNIK